MEPTFFQDLIGSWSGIQYVKYLLVFDEQGMLVFAYPEAEAHREGEGGVYLEVFKSCRRLLRRVSDFRFRAFSLYHGKDEISTFRLKPLYIALVNEVGQKQNMEKHVSNLLLNLKAGIKKRYAAITGAVK